jgi:hypothetical protein
MVVVTLLSELQAVRIDLRLRQHGFLDRLWAACVGVLSWPLVPIGKAISSSRLSRVRSLSTRAQFGPFRELFREHLGLVSTSRSATPNKTDLLAS